MDAENIFKFPGSTDEIESWAKNRLTTPEGAVRKPDKKGGEVATFPEIIQLNDISFDLAKKLSANAKAGDVVGILAIQGTVDLASGSVNAGRRVRGRSYFNASAFGRDDGQTLMTRNSYGTLFSLIEAVGADKALAADPSAFVAAREVWLGQRVRAIVEQQFLEDGKVFENLRLFGKVLD